MSLTDSMKAITSVAMGVLGTRLDPYGACNFLVEIEGLLSGGFREVKGLESSVDIKEYSEGGCNEYTHRLPGAVKHTTITLSRGLIDLDAMWNWYDEVTRGVLTRRNMTIMLLDARRVPVQWWDVRAALPIKWTGPTLNAESDAVATETLEFIHNGVAKPAASQALTAVRAVGDLIG